MGGFELNRPLSDTILIGHVTCHVTCNIQSECFISEYNSFTAMKFVFDIKSRRL